MYRPSRSSPTATSRIPTNRVRAITAPSRPLSGRSVQHRTGGQRGGGRGGHHHQRGAAEQPAADLAGERRVQAVGRVHPDQQGHRHAVGHRGDGVGDAGDGVGPQVPGPRAAPTSASRTAPADPDATARARVRRPCGRGSSVRLSEGRSGSPASNWSGSDTGSQVRLLGGSDCAGSRSDGRGDGSTSGGLRVATAESGHPGLSRSRRPHFRTSLRGRAQAVRPGRHRDDQGASATQLRQQGADAPGSSCGPPGQFIDPADSPRRRRVSPCGGTTANSRSPLPGGQQLRRAGRRASAARRRRAANRPAPAPSNGRTRRRRRRCAPRRRPGRRSASCRSRMVVAPSRGRQNAWKSCSPTSAARPASSPRRPGRGGGPARSAGRPARRPTRAVPIR